MKLQHGHTYRTRCGWVGKCVKSDIDGYVWLLGNDVYVEGYGNRSNWLYKRSGVFVGQGYDSSNPMHIVAEVTTGDTARASLIESLRGIALAWQEPLAKAHMIALLEIIDELKKELEAA